MNWVATIAVTIGAGVIAGVEAMHAHLVVIGAAVILGAVWISAVWTRLGRPRVLTWLAFIGVAISGFAMYMGDSPYATLGAVTSFVIGWEAGLSARELAPFPKRAQRAFARARIPLLGITAVVGFALGTGLLSVRLYLSFGVALVLSAVALALMVVFLVALALVHDDR